MTYNRVKKKKKKKKKKKPLIGKHNKNIFLHKNNFVHLVLVLVFFFFFFTFFHFSFTIQHDIILVNLKVQNLTERLYILENDDAIDHKPSLIMKSATLVLGIYNDYKVIYMR